MKKVYILLAILICLPLISADLFPSPSVDVGIGFGDGTGQTGVNVFRPEEILNVSAANVNHSNTASLAFDSLLFNDYSLFNYMNGYVRAQQLVCFLSGGVDCTMTGNILMGNNDITGVNDITGTGNIDFINPDIGVNTLSLNSTNPIALSAIRAGSNTGSFASLVSIGSQFPGANISANDSGIIAGGGRLIFVNNGEEDIAFAHVTSGDSNFSNASFSFRLDSSGNAYLSGDLFLEDEDKSIRTVAVDGGSAIVLDSNDSIISGGFPVIEVARTSGGERVVSRWSQNGRNNSFSGFMNSIGPVPKSWINFSGQTDEEGISFLFNRSDYPNYCDYLQTNLSLVPEGCKYFADTSGRLVPLLFAGDLEVHRTATIHDGALIFNDFQYIGRNGNDADFFFTNETDPGKLQVRDNRNVLANITDFNNVVCNFDDGSLCELYSDSVLPEVGRDWSAVFEPECHQDGCANAKGGNLKIMSVDSVTLGATNVNISIWLTTVISGSDSFYIISDDHIGNVTTIFTETATVSDQNYTFALPSVFWGKLNVTTSFYLDGQNAVREAWVDDIQVQATLDPSVIINESYEGGRIVIGEDRGELSCALQTVKRANNATFGTEWFLEIGSPDCNVDIVGNVTFTDSTVVNQTVIGDQLVTGDLTVLGNTTSSYYFGNGSQLTGITHTDISGLVPYQNATADVYLNNYTLKAQNIKSDSDGSVSSNGGLLTTENFDYSGVVNGDFNTTINNWTNIYPAYWSWSSSNGGSAKYAPAVVSLNEVFEPTIPLDITVGKTYQVIWEMNSHSTHNMNVTLGGETVFPTTQGLQAWTNYSRVIVATSTDNLKFNIKNNVGLSFLTTEIDNIVVKELGAWGNIITPNDIVTIDGADIYSDNNIELAGTLINNFDGLGDDVVLIQGDSLGTTDATRNILTIDNNWTGAVTGSGGGNPFFYNINNLMEISPVNFAGGSSGHWANSYHEITDTGNSFTAPSQKTTEIVSTYNNLIHNGQFVITGGLVTKNNIASKNLITDTIGTVSGTWGVTMNNYGTKTDIVSSTHAENGGNISVTNYGEAITLSGKSGMAGGSTNYGIYLGGISGADENWAIYSNNNAPSYLGGDINVTGNYSGDIYKFGNGAWIGYNATCQMIFYNSTGGIMSTQGCS